MCAILTILTIFLFTNNFVSCNQTNLKMIGGEETEIEKYPYLASIRFYDNHICSGAIITEQNIITSYECVKELRLNKLTVRVGATKHEEGQEVQIQNILKHPLYDSDSKENDICILYLTSRLVFSKQINKVELYSTIDFNDFDGEIAEAIGWGLKDNKDEKVSDTLQKIDETIINYYECNAKYGMNMISEKMICAQNVKKGICKGDIGGPLILNNKLIGLASWNYDCATSNYPDVFTDITFFTDWINKNII